MLPEEKIKWITMNVSYYKVFPNSSHREMWRSWWKRSWEWKDEQVDWEHKYFRKCVGRMKSLTNMTPKYNVRKDHYTMHASMEGRKLAKFLAYTTIYRKLLIWEWKRLSSQGKGAKIGHVLPNNEPKRYNCMWFYRVYMVYISKCIFRYK